MSLNEKQEKFAQSYILHRNATEAARAAGYAKESAYNQGYRLLQNEEIKERIEDLEKELTTDVDVVSELEQQYTYAKNNGHTNSAIKALELLPRKNTTRTPRIIFSIICACFLLASSIASFFCFRISACILRTSFQALGP